jgi:hypothetical protein
MKASTDWLGALPLGILWCGRARVGIHDAA